MSSHTYEQARELTTDLQNRLVRSLTGDASVDRRTVLGGLGLAGGAAIAGSRPTLAADGHDDEDGGHHGKFGAKGDYRSDDFDPHEFLTEFETGTVRQEGGETVREFELRATDTTVEIAPGVEFTAWVYNGQVPGPTLRAIEGETIRVRFENQGAHAHTIHPHLRNLAPEMDGIPQNGPGVLETNETFTYEWKAQPAGFHFYHCHSLPLKEHIHRGLYGGVIVDPDPERVRERPREYVNYQGPMNEAYVDELVERARSRNHTYDANDEVQELVMVMNGFDTNFDGDNEVYAVNTRAFAYGVGWTDAKGDWKPSEGGTIKPIQVDGQRPIRVYLLNTIEFDLINSFHTHSQFFDYYDHGTTLMPTHKNVDTIMQCQAQRGIIELDYSTHDPGLYMFHAHQSEFAELGWMSFFEVV